MPAITGGLVLAGAPEVTGPTGAVVALLEPYWLVAVTSTRSFTPRSAVPTV